MVTPRVLLCVAVSEWVCHRLWLSATERFAKVRVCRDDPVHPSRLDDLDSLSSASSLGDGMLHGRAVLLALIQRVENKEEPMGAQLFQALKSKPRRLGPGQESLVGEREGS